MSVQLSKTATTQTTRKSDRFVPSETRTETILRIRQMTAAARWDEDEMDVSSLLTSSQLMNLRNS